MTKGQRAVYDAIVAFVAERGYPPSVRQIGELVGLSSSSTIHAHLDQLRKRGFVEWVPGAPRTLRIINTPEGRAS